MNIIINSNGRNPAKIVDGEVDLSFYLEPTKSILQKAFDSGDYTVPEAVEMPFGEYPPDWSAFMKEMDEKGLFMVGLTANFAVFTQIFNMLLAMRDKQSLANEDCIEWRNFRLMYTLGREAFSSGQLTQIEAAMILANIPVIE